MHRPWVVLMVLLSSVDVFGLNSDVVSQPETGNTVVAPGYCSMYGTCDRRRNLPCQASVPAKSMDDMIGKFQLTEFCQDVLDINSPLCCNSEQVAQLAFNLQMARPLLNSCGACWRNFRALWCQFTCSSNQSLFLRPTQVSPLGAVEKLEYSIDPRFGQGIWNSCQDVIIPAMNTYAIKIIAGSNATSFVDMLLFQGKTSGMEFAIRTDTPSSPRVPHYVEPYPCNTSDPTYRCVCTDCSDSCVALHQPKQHGQCRVGALNCYSFAFIIIYSVFLLGILGKWLYYQNWSKLLPLFRGYRALRNRHAQEDIVEPVSGDLDDTSESSRRAQISREEQEDGIYPRVRNAQLFSRINAYLTKLSWSINLKLQRAFYWIGYICAYHPYIVISIGLLFVLVCSLGWIRFSVETDPIKLWSSPSSTVVKQKELYEQYFGPVYRVEQVIITKKDGASVMTTDDLRKITKIQDDIVNNLHALYDQNTNVTLKDICLNPLGDGCLIQSIPSFFAHISYNNGSSSFANVTFVTAERVETCLNSPTDLNCRPESGAILSPDFLLGGVDADYMSAKATFITFLVKGAQDENRRRKAEVWELALIDYLKNLESCRGDNCGINGDVTVEGLQLSFSSEVSMEKELNSENHANAVTIAISYILMFLYVSFSLGRFNNMSRLILDSRFVLALESIILVLMSVSAAVGLFSYFEVSITLIIAEVIPFLILAVGVDNLFLMINEFDRIDPELYVEERVAKCMGTIGPSITLSALTQSIAFACGAMVTMPAVRVFSMYASLAVFLNALLQMTVFPSLLALDAARSDDNRIDCLPCITLFDSLPKSANPQESYLQSFMRKHFCRVILKSRTKKWILFFFMSLFVFCLSSVPYLKLGLDQRIALPSSSYLINYFDDVPEYLNTGPPVYFVASNIDVKTREGQQKICGRFSTCNEYSIGNTLQQEQRRPDVSSINEPPNNWLDDFFMWLNPLFDACCLETDDGKPCTDPDDLDCHTCWTPEKWNMNMTGFPEGDTFTRYLKRWFDYKPSDYCPFGGVAYKDAVSLDPATSEVTMMSFRTFHKVLRTQSDFINAYKNAKEVSEHISKANDIQVFPYSMFYVFFAQYEDLASQAISILGTGLFAIIHISSLFLGIRHALLLGFLVAVMLVDVAGFMVWWNVSLNAISVVNLGICMGISVEFLVHVLRAYSINGGSRTERVVTAISEVGSSVFSGITLTKFIGVMVLSFAPSKIFETYYFRVYFLVVILGALHGLILLPILLTYIGSRGVLKSDTLCVRTLGEQNQSNLLSSGRGGPYLRRTSNGSVGRGRYTDENDVGYDSEQGEEDPLLDDDEEDEEKWQYNEGDI